MTTTTPTIIALEGDDLRRAREVTIGYILQLTEEFSSEGLTHGFFNIESIEKMHRAGDLLGQIDEDGHVHGVWKPDDARIVDQPLLREACIEYVSLHEEHPGPLVISRCEAARTTLELLDGAG